MEYRFNYNVTGPNRKRLVEAIAEIHGGTPRYLGAPTFAYGVDCFTVSKNGAVTFDGGKVERDAVKALVEGLERRGFVADAAQEAANAPVTAIPATEALTVGDAPESRQEATVAETCGFCPEFPRDGITDAAIDNLRKLVDSKAALIRKALGADSLDIIATDETVSFPWFQNDIRDEDKAAVARFLERLIAAAGSQKRVTAKEKPVENEKYAFRCFLLRLGFIGDEYKADRKALLRNLTGSSAFRSGGPKAGDERTAKE